MVKVNKLKHEERLNKKKVRLMNLISFILGFSAAITAYIISSYFKEVKGADNVSIFYSIAYIIALISLLNFHKLIKKFGKSKIFLISLILMAASSLLIFFFPVSWLGLFLIIINIILYNLCLVGKDIVLESYSTDRMSGRIRGLHLTLMNVGFIFGPFIAMRILERFNFQGVFLLQFVLILIIFFIAFKNLRKVNHKFKPVVTLEGLFKKIFKRKNVLRIYYISFLLEFFYFIAVVYIPIYLRNLGMEWSKIGIIFTFMLIPFVLLQYPTGILADKKWGERELIIFGLFMMSATTLTIYFIDSTSIVIWAVILFSTRIGAALIEILRDSYFYKRIDGADVDVIDFFRTSRALAFLTASIVSAIMLLFLPLNYIFVLLAIVLFTGLYPALRLTDNLSEEEVRELKK
jgi:MFS family permease